MRVCVLLLNVLPPFPPASQSRALGRPAFCFWQDLEGLAGRSWSPALLVDGVSHAFSPSIRLWRLQNYSYWLLGVWSWPPRWTTSNDCFAFLQVGFCQA